MSSVELDDFDSDQISLDVELSDVLSFISAVKLDACSLPMSSVKLDAFDGDLIRLEMNGSREM
ncbi:hypothetical protein F2Q68_00025052 [Brassica cretica]|uniref:Uncharacterized protein n=1 Tax=Brassica cretica TaxID=69181 RepID=A0A8S9IF64_BRACR|nr:hypothetical protein F2Q68_00025052 [Brassica cretica]